MDVSKLQDAAKELEAEGNRCLRLAADLRAAIKRSMDGGEVKDVEPEKSHPLKLKHRGDAKKSFLVLAVDILRSRQEPMHIGELVEKVSEKRAGATRSQVESALVRGMAAGKFRGVIKRTSPGTFTAQ